MTRRLGAAVAALLAVLTLTTLGASSASSATDGPMYGAPSAGRCYDVSAYELNHSASTTATTVPCSDPHRAFITQVVQLPATMDYGTNPYNKLWRQTCIPAVAKALGTAGIAYAESTYYGGYSFIPTDDERAHGAHWLSCMLARDIRGSVARTVGKPKLPHPLSARYQNCTTARLNWTTCADSHKYHVIAVTTIAYRDYTRRHEVAACINEVPRLAKDNDWVSLAKLIGNGSRVAILCQDN